MALNIAINGCGRIGRSLARLALKSKDFNLVAINDIAPIQNTAYGLRFDSVHQTHLDVHVQDQTLCIDGHMIHYSSEQDPTQIDFGRYGASVVFEASGLFLTQEQVKHHLTKGVQKIIFTAPAKDHSPTFVMGVNHHQYKGEQIFSNASCTTNCLAPIAMLLDEHYGIKKGIITTIHSYTNDQKILDSVHISDVRRSRAGATNIIPTTTGAAKAISLVLPNLHDKLHGHSVRVPTPNVSMLDLNVQLHQFVQAKEVNDMFEQASQTSLKGILKLDSHYGVSSDFCNDPHSCIVAKDLTFVIEKDMLKVMAWYDNEWGYTHRLLDMARFTSSFSQ